MRHRVFALLAALLAAALVGTPAGARQQEPVVRAVLFFSPSCGHCEYVIQEVLPPLFGRHGGPWELVFDETLAPDVSFYLLRNDALEFLAVDVTLDEGASLFRSSSAASGIDSGGVPRLVVGDEVMIGSSEIPERLPGIVDEALGGSGIDWPAIPGLDAALASIPQAPPPSTSTASPGTTIPTSTPVTTPEPTLPVAGDSVADRFGRDPLANSVAVLVLLGMLLSLRAAFALGRRRVEGGRVGAAVPVLAAAGLLVAAYLSTVELGDMDAMCGPVGDCNAVQQSAYARLFGVPIGVIGVIGYVAVLAAWIVQRLRSDRHAEWARALLLGGAVAGVAFSIYLTSLEPFVIGATCAWCLTSAVIVTAVMWLALRPGVAAWRRLHGGRRFGSELE